MPKQTWKSSKTGTYNMDDQNKKPYKKKYDTIWEGLGILDYVIVPHYKSDHFESEAVEESIQYLIDNKILPFSGFLNNIQQAFASVAYTCV